MKLVNIEARDLPDAWFQCVYAAIEKGRDFKIDRGSYAGMLRKEFDHIRICIRYPEVQPILPEIPEQYGIPNPVEYDYVYGGEKYPRSYVEYLMSAVRQPGESYTYGQRLTKAPLSKEELVQMMFSFPDMFYKDSDLWEDPQVFTYENDVIYLNQIEWAIRVYRKGHRNNQLVLQVARPTDLILTDPPCLRQIDTRVQDGKLHFIIEFRSWDLWSGFPANLAAIQTLHQHMAVGIGVDTGCFICSSKGLHLYDYVFELAEIIRGKTAEEFRRGK